MTKRVSFSEFRKNLSKYIEILKKDGSKITLEDARSGKKLITLRKDADIEDFDWDEHMKFIDKIGGSGLLASKEDELARKQFRKEINTRFNQARER